MEFVQILFLIIVGITLWACRGPIAFLGCLIVIGIFWTCVGIVMVILLIGAWSLDRYDEIKRMLIQ